MLASKMQQVQLRHPRPGAPSLRHERFLVPLPGHLVAVCRGGEGGDAPAGSGDGIPPHPSHPGVPLPPPRCHGAGAIPRPWAHVEGPQVLCQGLRGGVWPGRGVVSRGEWSNLHLQVFRSIPLHQRRGECSTVRGLDTLHGLESGVTVRMRGMAGGHIQINTTAARNIKRRRQ